MVKKPARSIVAAVAAAAARWSDAAYAPRARARAGVSARTGYSPDAVDFAFDALFRSLRRDAIESVVQDELGSIDVLDGFVDRSGRPPTRALPIGRVCIVSSRTTVGVAIVPAVFALCARCDVEVKDRDDALVAAFFETLAGELDGFRDAARARAWDGAADVQSLAGFDAVVAFGNDATLASISATLAYPTRFVAYGSKASAGYVGREALTSEDDARAIARGAARDLVLYDSEGCLSLHALFVEQGGFVTPQRFTELLGDAIGGAAGEFGMPVRGDAAARRAASRDLAAFRGDVHVYSPPDAGYLAVLDPPLDERPAFLPLTIGVRSVDEPAQAAAYLERHGIAIEALAVAQRRSDLVALAQQVGASRVARFGSLQTPQLGGFHGGRPRIAEFVRWIVDET